MDHSRHSKRHRSSSKSKKNSKKKRSRDENGSGTDNIVVSVSSSVIKPLVEYSDVSSEDLSEPEAGEIQSEESPSFSEGDAHQRGAHHSAKKPTVIDEDREYRHLSRKSLVIAHSPTRRSAGSHRLVDSTIVSHSPSPLNERKHSVSSDVSRTSSMRHRKRHDSSPAFTMRHVISSPTLTLEEYDIRRHRKKKEKKHKREKKASKKKKKKSKHRSPSSSPEDVSEPTPESPAKARLLTDSEREQLSDWEQPVPPAPYRAASIDRVDTVTCSPVSPPSNNTSPEQVHERIDSPVTFSPRTATPPQPPPPTRKYLTSVESPHTPQLPPKAYEVTKVEDEDFDSSYSGRKQLSSPIFSDPHRSISPVRIAEYHHNEPVWIRQHSLSPVKSSPFRNPSPDVQIISGGSMSPSRKRRRMDKEMSHSHRRHRKEKERMKDRRRVSRSRSPMVRRHRSSRSPSWSRSRHYSRSSSRTRTSKRYRSRTPKRIPSPRSPPPR